MPGEFGPLVKQYRKPYDLVTLLTSISAAPARVRASVVSDHLPSEFSD